MLTFVSPNKYLNKPVSAFLAPQGLSSRLVSELRAARLASFMEASLSIASRLFWSCQISAPLVYLLYPCDKSLTLERAVYALAFT